MGTDRSVGATWPYLLDSDDTPAYPRILKDRVRGNSVDSGVRVVFDVPNFRRTSRPGVSLPDESLEKLAGDIELGKVVAVVGSGISIGTTGGLETTSWTGLLRHGIHRCLNQGLMDSARAERILLEL